MGLVARPSVVIVLVEDSRHEQFVFRYLRRLGFGFHEMHILKAPPGTGSAEQWVRSRFPREVQARHSRQAETILVVAIDADRGTLRQRERHLDQALLDAGL